METFHLIVDVGNSRTKFALYKKGKVVGKVWSTPKPLIKDIKSFIGKSKISKVGLSRVGKLSPSIYRFLSENFQMRELTEKTKVPIKNKCKTPRTLGKDRLAAVIGATVVFPNKPCLVIDAGTCVTYDLINDQKEYLGGGISPGIHLRFKAMNDYTAALPLVPLNPGAEYLGRNTKESLQAGAQWGFLLEIEGFIRRYRKDFPGLKVLATGGDSEYLAEKLKTKIFVHPNLVLDGLNKILDK